MQIKYCSHILWTYILGKEVFLQNKIAHVKLNAQAKEVLFDVNIQQLTIKTSIYLAQIFRAK
mgnify:CR=1 FL=1